MTLSFGPFVLDEDARELLRDGEPVSLQPRALELLFYLARNRDRTVGKNELLDTLWADVTVSDASIERAVSLVRSELRKGGCENAIQTRPKLGYRFVLRETGMLATELLEREQFLKQLDEKLARARAGVGQAVFISGEAGIGKSALLGAFFERIPSGSLVARGFCEALSTPRALGPVLEILSRLGLKLPAEIEAGYSREVAFNEALDRLRAAEKETVVALEDLHWADEASLDFVRFLGRRIGQTRALLLTSYRDDEAGSGHPLRRVLGDLSGQQVTRMRLPPLSTEAVNALARRKDRDGARLYALTGGNAFLVTELLSSPSEEVPTTVQDSLIARLSRCAPAAQRACELVALSPGGLELPLLTTLMSGEANSSDAIDEAVERGLLVHDRGSLTFRHELARLGVEEMQAPAKAASIHARILALLEAERADIARLVHHARCASDSGAVYRHAPVAGARAAAVGAHREAAAHFAAALAVTDQGSEASKVELLERHAYECYLTSHIPAAIASQERALAIRRTLPNETAIGRALRLLSRFFWYSGNRERADTHARQAVELLERQGESGELAMAYSNRSQLAMLAGDTETALAFGEKALQLAQALGQPEIESHALNNIGSARLSTGDRRGEESLLQALQIALDHDFHEHAARAYVNLGSSGTVNNDLTARRYLEQGLAYCEQRDLDSWSTYLRVFLARFSLDRGAWDQAAERASALLRETISASIVRIPALVIVGLVRTRRGDPGANEALDEALTLALPTGELQRIGPVAAARAEAAWYGNDSAAVLRETERGLQYGDFSRGPWFVGELLFWKSQATAVNAEDPRCPEPFQLALAQHWFEAAEAFRAHEMPYQEALMLLRTGQSGIKRARIILKRLGASRLLASPRSSSLAPYAD
jgi:DNA-binding winged helix-turn-helix (wHTH) protein/tetratricopeptide (TPR) repeat protein